MNGHDIDFQISEFRCGHYRNWDDTKLMNSMLAVEKGVSLRHAAEMYGVPKSTLHDHVKGKVPFGARSGPDPYLSVEEEEELTNFLIEVAQIGYPHTKKQVLSLAQRIISAKGLKSPVSVSNGWWERFCKRNPRITLRSAVPLSLSRASATDPEMLHRYFDTLEDCLRKNDIFNNPGTIFNCDETGLALNPPCLRVVQAVGAKNSSFVTGGEKAQITVLACTCAAGYAIPPYVIFDRLTWNPRLADGEVPGSLYGLSKNGWINSELFDTWFYKKNLNYAPRNRPLLLLLDGHSSHYCPSTITAAAEEGILLFVLPPNTTHITQPLDKGCFSPLKILWRQVCHEFRRSNPGRVVTRFDFCGLFSETWYDAMSSKNVIASFETTGVCPFNRQAIKVPGMKEERFTLFQPENLLERTGLNYIPIYSPSRCSRSKFRITKEVDGNPVSPHCQLDDTTEAVKESECSPLPFHSTVPPPNTLSARFGRANSVPLRTTTALSKFLNPPIHPSKISKKGDKPCGSCLTSAEGLKKLEEKQKLKEEKQNLKEEKAKLREEKQKLKKEKAELKKGCKKKSQQGKGKTKKLRYDNADSSDDENLCLNLYEQSDNDSGDLDSTEKIVLDCETSTTSISAVWIKSLSLTKLDENVLLSEGQLTADHMCAGQLLLKHLYPLQEGLNDTSYLSDKLAWKSKPTNFVQIVHVRTNHWACLSNKGCSSGEVELFDSMHKCLDPDESVVRQVCTILKSPKKNVTIKIVDVQQQCGSTQCGLFSLAFASDLCANRDPSTRVYFESKLRNHLLKCFVAQKMMDPFPSRIKRKLPEERIVKASVVDIFCVCRQPEKLPMACCDGCCEWYHSSCMTLPVEVFSDSKVKWCCKLCDHADSEDTDGETMARATRDRPSQKAPPSKSKPAHLYSEDKESLGKTVEVLARDRATRGRPSQKAPSSKSRPKESADSEDKESLGKTVEVLARARATRGRPSQKAPSSKSRPKESADRDTRDRPSQKAPPSKSKPQESADSEDKESSDDETVEVLARATRGRPSLKAPPSKLKPQESAPPNKESSGKTVVLVRATRGRPSQKAPPSKSKPQESAGSDTKLVRCSRGKA